MSGIRASPVGLKDQDDDYSFYLLKTDVERLAQALDSVGIPMNGGDGTNSTSSNSPFLRAGNNLSDLTSTSTGRTNLGLGTLALQNANAIAVTGGTIAGTSLTTSSFANGTIASSHVTSPLTVDSTADVVFDSGVTGRTTTLVQTSSYFGILAHDGSFTDSTIAINNSTGAIAIATNGPASIQSAYTYINDFLFQTTAGPVAKIISSYSDYFFGDGAGGVGKLGTTLSLATSNGDIAISAYSSIAITAPSGVTLTGDLTVTGFVLADTRMKFGNAAFSNSTDNIVTTKIHVQAANGTNYYILATVSGA